jgi:hypothetical protein
MVRLFLIGIVGELAFQAAAQANPPTPEFMGSELHPLDTLRVAAGYPLDTQMVRASGRHPAYLADVGRVKPERTEVAD